MEISAEFPLLSATYCLDTAWELGKFEPLTNGSKGQSSPPRQARKAVQPINSLDDRLGCRPECIRQSCCCSVYWRCHVVCTLVLQGSIKVQHWLIMAPKIHISCCIENESQKDTHVQDNHKESVTAAAASTCQVPPRLSRLGNDALTFREHIVTFSLFPSLYCTVICQCKWS